MKWKFKKVSFKIALYLSVSKGFCEINFKLVLLYCVKADERGSKKKTLLR